MEIVWVPVEKCRPNNFNPNVMSPEKFEALCDFLRTHSAEELDPIWVRRDGADGFEIVDGEHRWKAAKAVGWKHLRAFILDVGEDDAKAFNVRKNRERGRIDAIKFGKILYEEHQAGATLEELAKKYGYSYHGKISDFIQIYRYREQILEKLNIDPAGSKIVTYHKALKVLRELKQKEKEQNQSGVGGSVECGVAKPEPAVGEVVDDRLVEAGSLERFARDYAEALKKVASETPKENRAVTERILALIKDYLEKSGAACPICGERKLVWRCGHEF
jgi:ParB/RepB/Spo0J family partition protein